MLNPSDFSSQNDTNLITFFLNYNLIYPYIFIKLEMGCFLQKVVIVHQNTFKYNSNTPLPLLQFQSTIKLTVLYT